MRKLVVIGFLILALLLFAQPALAQGEGEPPFVPDWAGALALGSISVAAFAAVLTQITKWVLNLVGLLPDDGGRYIVIFWVVVGVLVVLAVDIFGLREQVTPAWEALYGLATAFLGLLTAAGGFMKAKDWGLVKSITP